MTSVVKLNLGCGAQTPAGWINVDFSLGAKLVKLPLFSYLNRRLKLFRTDWNEGILLHDLRRRFPWTNDSVDIIYSSHTLEHFSKAEGIHFLSECYRVLKTGGILRLVVPDLRVLVDQYIQGAIPADEFVEKLEVGYESAGDRYLQKVLAPYTRFPHKCMYDSATLQAKAKQLGFAAASKMPFESSILDIRSVEQEDRTNGAVIVEGVKTNIMK